MMSSTNALQHVAQEQPYERALAIGNRDTAQSISSWFFK
jgi:hypothetical protein